jgi:hypothetical protein
MKNGIGRQLEAVAAMGLEPECLQEAMHAGLGDAGFGGQAAYAPMGGAILGPGVQGRVEKLRDALVVDRARLARAQLVVQALDPAGDEAPAPLAHRGVGGGEAPRDRAAGRARGAREHHVGALHQRCR